MSQGGREGGVNGRVSAVGSHEDKPADYYIGDRAPFLDWVGGTYRRVLEVGCGAGGNADWFRQHGAEFIAGIELVPEVARVAATRFDHVRVGAVELELANVQGPFDLIVCGDVLEPLEDPWTVLGRLVSVSHNATILAVSIPNIRYYRALMRIAFGSGFKYESSGIFDVTHLRFFTKRNVEEMLQQSGWTPRAWGPPARRGRLLRWLTRDRWFEWRAIQLFVTASPAQGSDEMLPAPADIVAECC